jgi:uncharacterized protein YwbE
MKKVNSLEKLRPRFTIHRSSLEIALPQKENPESGRVTKGTISQVLVAHTCHPSFLGG